MIKNNKIMADRRIELPEEAQRLNPDGEGRINLGIQEPVPGQFFRIEDGALWEGDDENQINTPASSETVSIALAWIKSKIHNPNVIVLTELENEKPSLKVKLREGNNELTPEEYLNSLRWSFAEAAKKAMQANKARKDPTDPRYKLIQELGLLKKVLAPIQKATDGDRREAWLIFGQALGFDNWEENKIEEMEGIFDLAWEQLQPQSKLDKALNWILDGIENTAHILNRAWNWYSTRSVKKQLIHATEEHLRHHEGVKPEELLSLVEEEFKKFRPRSMGDDEFRELSVAAIREAFKPRVRRWRVEGLSREQILTRLEATGLFPADQERELKNYYSLSEHTLGKIKDKADALDDFVIGSEKGHPTERMLLGAALVAIPVIIGGSVLYIVVSQTLGFALNAARAGLGVSFEILKLIPNIATPFQNIWKRMNQAKHGIEWIKHRKFLHNYPKVANLAKVLYLPAFILSATEGVGRWIAGANPAGEADLFPSIPEGTNVRYLKGGLAGIWDVLRDWWINEKETAVRNMQVGPFQGVGVPRHPGESSLVETIAPAVDQRLTLVGKTSDLGQAIRELATDEKRRGLISLVAAVLPALWKKMQEKREKVEEDRVAANDQARAERGEAIRRRRARKKAVKTLRSATPPAADGHDHGHGHGH